jgi:alkaline phosphatase D
MHPERQLSLINCATAGSRRQFIVTSASLAAAAVWSSRAVGALKQNVKLPDHPFQLGVASGDPSPDGFVIWTRLAPRPLEGGGMPSEAVEVAWQVAEDEAMSRVVQKGTTVASPDWAHAVHVEVAGLKAKRPYWYQFKAAGQTSPVGRTRTLPASYAMPAVLKFAFASCQHYEQGLYTAYEHMAKEDLDLVIHLGDYIYEGAGRAPQADAAKPGDGKKGGGGSRLVRRHIGPKLTTLEDFRVRHAQYKSDPLLQAVHALFPWLVTWDDHEFENNCAGDISERQGVTREEFLKLRANAYKAYYEHMPLRRANLPTGPDMQLYRRVAYGRLAEFSVLDTRQYRTDQPCGDGTRPPCDEMLNPAATLLGERQEKWLLSGLAQSPATWNVLAQQVMMGRVDRAADDRMTYSMDQWPGYEMNRRRILNFFAKRKVANPVVLTGDIHSNWVNNLNLDFDGLDGRTVATEFVGTSISSGGDGSATPRDLEGILRDNPFVKFHNTQRGYVRCEVTPKSWKSDYQMVEYVSRPGAGLITRGSFVVEAERPGAQPA